MIIRKSTYRKALDDAHAKGRGETPVVHVAAGDLHAARYAARRVEHPNGDRGRAILATKPQDLQGHRGGVFIRGWGAPDELIQTARERGMVVVDVFA